MNRYETMANQIIDRVIDAIYYENPDILETSKSLLYGEPYYELEDEIACELMEFSKCVMNKR